jgi:hypothetical protein
MWMNVKTEANLAGRSRFDIRCPSHLIGGSRDVNAGGQVYSRGETRTWGDSRNRPYRSRQ